MITMIAAPSRPAPIMMACCTISSIAWNRCTHSVSTCTSSVSGRLSSSSRRRVIDCAVFAGLGLTTSVCGRGLSGRWPRALPKPDCSLNSASASSAATRRTSSTSARCDIKRASASASLSEIPVSRNTEKSSASSQPLLMAVKFLMTRLSAAGIASVTAMTRIIIRLANGWCTSLLNDADAVLP